MTDLAVPIGRIGPDRSIDVTTQARMDSSGPLAQLKTLTCYARSRTLVACTLLRTTMTPNLRETEMAQGGMR